MSEPVRALAPEEQGLLDSLPDLVYRYRVRPPPGFDYVSPSSTAVIGYTPEDLTPILSWVDGSFARTTPPLTARCVKRPNPDAVYRIRWRHKDGRELTTEQRLQPIRDRD